MGLNAASQKKGIWYELRKNRGLYLFMLPGILYTFILGYVTLPYMIIAFEDFDYKKGIFSPWVGLENFRFFFESNRAWEVTFNTILLNALFLFFGTLVSVGLALILNEVKSKAFVRISQSTMLFPYFISWVIVSYILYAMLSTEKGVFNNILTAVGLDRVRWYSRPELWRGILVFAKVWKSAGYTMIIYLAAIVGIDHSLYEAAAIDGANAWQRFWFIIVPSIRQVIFVNLVINISGALSIYEMPYIMTGGANGTKTFLMNILDTAFKYNKYGVASSMSLVLLAVVLLVAALQKAVIGKEEKMQ